MTERRVRDTAEVGALLRRQFRAVLDTLGVEWREHKGWFGNPLTAAARTTTTLWGIQYDDGETDAMDSRTACVEALAAIQAGIDRGATTSRWEPA